MQAAIQAEEDRKARMDRFSQLAPVRIAGFPAEEVVRYTFANDDGQRPQLTAAMEAYVRNFTQLRKGGKGLLLYGNVGTGKTFAGGCIVNALEAQGHPCLMTSFSRLEKVLFDMKEGKRSFLDKLLLFDLVLFDDLGVERDTEYMTEQVTNILDSFYRAGIPMIITSNYGPKQLTAVEDIRKQRVYDRLLERCHPILVDGESRRKQQGRHDYAGMKQLLGL
jgi:DNA replication protein DnaC